MYEFFFSLSSHHAITDHNRTSVNQTVQSTEYWIAIVLWASRQKKMDTPFNHPVVQNFYLPNSLFSYHRYLDYKLNHGLFGQYELSDGKEIN